jgi:uncharacterized membrane protein YccC
METSITLDTCEKIDFYMEPPPDESVTEQKLPTPWLADSEWLLKELAKTREAILRIPQLLDNASDIKSAIDRIWRLEETLRYLLNLHREGQRQFAKHFQTTGKRATKKARKNQRNVIRIRAGYEKEFEERPAKKELDRLRGLKS